MNIQTQAQYEEAKAHLEAIGFNNVPPSTNIDWTKPVPVSITANVSRQTIVTTTNSVPLTP